MKRLALTAGGLMLLAGTAFAQNQGSKTTETRSQTQTQDIQKTTPAPSQQNPSDLDQTNKKTSGDINRNEVQPQRGTEQTEPLQNADEPKKHLTAVELYTKSALDNSKLLYQAAELPQGPMDKTIFKEAQQNITRDIQKADQHLTQFKSVAKANAPQGKADVMTKRDDLAQHLKDARMAAGKLSTSMGKDRAALRDQAAQVFTALNQANDSLKDIEDAYNVQSLDKIMPGEKAPVRGTEDMDNTKPLPRDTTQPGATPGKSEMNKSATPDMNTQPVQPNTPNTPDRSKKDVPKSPNY